MIKKYDEWNKKKKALSTKETEFLFKEGEIWWSSLGLNLGTESFGKGETFRRPVLVIRKLSSETCIVVPLTSKEKTGSWFTGINFQGENNWAMLYQIRMIHTKRFQRRLAELDHKDFIRVKEKLENLLELSPNNHSVQTEIGGHIPKVDLFYQDWLEESNQYFGEYADMMKNHA